MILDTFYLLFQSNSKDLVVGAKDAEKATDNLENKLKETEGVSTKLAGSFSGLIGAASGAIGAILSVSAVISGIHAATEYSHAIGQVSDQLGYSTEVLDAWGGAVEKAGGSASYFYSTVKTMDNALKEMAKGGDAEAAKAFKKLGIHIKDNHKKAREFIDLLPEIAKSFEGLSKSKSDELGSKMHLDSGTIMLLQKGGKEVEALIGRQKELGLVTQKDAEIAEKFKAQQNDTTHAFRSLFVSIASDVLPIFEKIYKFFESVAVYMRKNKDLVIGSVIGISVALLALVDVGKLLNIVFSKWLIIIPILAAIGSSIGLIYEDFVVFRKGGESAIGDIVKKFPELKDMLDLIGQAIDAVTGYFKEMNLTPFTALVKVLNVILEVIGAIYKAAKPLVSVIGAVADFAGENIAGNTENRNIADQLNKTTEENNRKRKLIQGTASAIGSFDRSSLSLQTPNSISSSSSNSNKTSNVTTGPITINTQATNSDEIANAFSQNLKKQMDHAQSNYDDGVLA